MKKILKKIKLTINIPLVIFLLISGSLLLIANINSSPVDQAKETVNNTVDQVSEKLNNAADDSTPLADDSN
ncbi:hypothetical protein [Francisella adeliensis]|uniref:Uncharacterized protein n=1 Tax=Francisella adeliensis TaxID=2007306 RepID=A0A2Z4Y0S6_9GAMM|nr:hypothetical protein [Francisella adeliensis]AXA34757.1 hypothetical protein CDH04_07610 [Francisella adeliensis]MBK2084920.1 hypothetical protein [Francisella adeliensis]MBK2096249.1 hypothetical protein [Francisella adeliensis]QIW12979.1 hypothetical protein FZC43_07615 [Francisella adeliensis]QIW14859.1 hypothetical protein FZC44_07610 [Francisella adeliensis]